jgi:pimeloyl-ACP methyl ester carboxylesterase
MLIAFAASPAVGARDDIREYRVKFTVQNVNNSQVPCESDGGTYELQGSLVAPASLLAKDHRAVTLYLHGGLLGESLWRFHRDGNPRDHRYDFAWKMAELGHASVTFDELGMTTGVFADAPDGRDVCFGSIADMAHQVIQHLRLGDYGITGADRAPNFDRVALAGLSGGGHKTQIESYSFHDADAIMVFGFADQTSTPTAAEPAAQAVAHTEQNCNGDAERKWGDSGPHGYFWLFNREDVTRFLLGDAEQSVADTFLATIERDACGMLTSQGRAIFQDNLGIPTIHIPVLLGYGENDPLWGEGGATAQKARYESASDDVTLHFFEGAGHIFFLNRGANGYRRYISSWLRERGF